MRIYVASSWRNNDQPKVVEALRAIGHEVYDFKNPRPGEHGFSWAQIDPAWESWSVAEWQEALTHPLAEAGFKSDFDAMKWADAMVLVLPCGRSAHLELGWAVGAGKRTCVLTFETQTEPDLMPKMCDLIATSLPEVDDWLISLKPKSFVRRCARWFSYHFWDFMDGDSGGD